MKTVEAMVVVKQSLTYKQIWLTVRDSLEILYDKLESHAIKLTAM